MKSFLPILFFLATAQMAEARVISLTPIFAACESSDSCYYGQHNCQLVTQAMALASNSEISLMGGCRRSGNGYIFEGQAMIPDGLDTPDEISNHLILK